MPLGAPTQITEGLKTVVVFDRFLPIVQQPFMAHERKASEMCRNKASSTNVAFTPGIGWTLKSHHMHAGGPYENTLAQDGFLTGSAVQLPTGVADDYSAKQEGYSGIGYSSDKAAQSDRGYRKRVVAGDDWDDPAYVLSADQSAFPGPATSEDLAPLDRMLASTVNHDPRDRLVFQFHVPGAPNDRFTGLAVCYFCGPAGRSGAETGFGQYALKLHTSGLAVLYERCDPGDGTPVWLERWSFHYSDFPAAGHAFYIDIASDTSQDGSGSFTGTKICFAAQRGPNLFRDTTNDERWKDLQNGTTASMRTQVYNVPRKDRLPTVQSLVRIDVRRDVRAKYSVSQHVYPESGLLVEDSFSVPFHPNGSPVAQLEWYGYRPTGTAVFAHLYDDTTGLPVTGTVIASDVYGEVVQYTLPSGDRSYHLEYEIQSDTTKFKTPVIEKRVFYREPVFDTAASFPLISVSDARTSGAPRMPVLFPASVDIGPASEYPETVNMRVTIDDLGGILPNLPFKTGGPMEVWLVDPDTNELVTIVEGGIVMRNTVRRYATKEKVYPDPSSYSLEVTGAGEWARAKRRLLSYRWTLPLDFLDSLSARVRPLKATDAVRLLLKYGAGYTTGLDWNGDPDGTPNMLDIPDLPQRLFNDAEGIDVTVVEPGTGPFEIVKEIVSDYTGGYLLFDKNAGEDEDTPGMWRLLLKHRPPYNNLMRIHREGPSDPLMIVSDLANYPDVVDGDTGQVMKCTFGIAGTESIEYEPAEGNLVQVFGGSGDGSSAGGSHPGMLTQVAFNPVSFNYFGLAPGHDFYPDPDSPDFFGECVAVQVYDYSLCTQDAVDWVTRRVYDAACFGREVVRVKFPISASKLVTDVLDPYQQRPRLPRFNDPVLYQQPDGSFGQYIVASCRPTWVYDGLIVCDAELVTTTNIDTYGLPIGAFDYFDLTRARIRAAKAASGVHANSRQTRQRQRTFSVNAVPFTGWPSSVRSEIQYLDPEESNFGQFKYMADYDPVP